jgi:1-acyl-sn-glycerol-3-phosphate acyltransferase
MGALRRVLRALRALVGLGAGLLLILSWLALKPRGDRSRRWTRAVWRTLRRSFALDVRVHGTLWTAPGTLYVANHISWTDIAVLGELLDAGFVAKSEVATWPIIGPGAARYQCVFIEREQRHTVAHQARAMATRLATGARLVLFAEGTTGDGSTVLPFRSSLFAGLGQGAHQRAGEGRGPVQPITLVPRHRTGRPFTPEERRAFAWLDDDELLPHAAALALSGGARVDVYFEEPVSGTDRKALAGACHAAISGRLAAELARPTR